MPPPIRAGRVTADATTPATAASPRRRPHRLTTPTRPRRRASAEEAVVIQPQTRLKVADNTGARSIQCIRVMGRSLKTDGRRG